MVRPTSLALGPLGLGVTLAVLLAPGGRADGPTRMPRVGDQLEIGWATTGGDVEPRSGDPSNGGAAGSPIATGLSPSFEEGMPYRPAGSLGGGSPMGPTTTSSTRLPGPLIGAVSTATSAAIDGTIVSTVLLPSGDQQVTVYDVAKQALLVYRIDAREGKLQLRSARRLTWDFEVETLASPDPTPAQVRAMVQPGR